VPATRIAIVGTGSIARIHAEALGSLSEPAQPEAAEVVAATDVDAEALAAFAAERGIPATYPTIGDLLASERPDLVHVCTPPSTHLPIALACLRAGTSVLVEKPPVISLRELDEVAAAQEQAGGSERPPWFATVFQHRFGASQRRLAALTQDPGVLGRPLVAICHTTWFRDQAYFDVPWRGRWETEGGGPTMGHGIHQMDMLLDILGDWAEVCAVTRTQARRTATEDLSLAHVTFASGAVASVVNSVVSPREESYLRFDFEHATVEVTHLYGYVDDDWRVTPAPGHDDVLAAWDSAVWDSAVWDSAAWKRAASGAKGSEDVPSSTTSNSAPNSASNRGKSGHADQFRVVLAALAAGTPPPVVPEDSRRTLSLVAAIYASAVTGRPVTRGDLAPGTPFYESMSGRSIRA
jgi:predicted dehydrogenase